MTFIGTSSYATNVLGAKMVSLMSDKLTVRLKHVQTTQKQASIQTEITQGIDYTLAIQVGLHAAIK